ncbi:hypothetical protein [Cesiribacter sp. SM1]|uniref:hypothetical protein n=1 Tax=Cesiribacter sp. SM1 TaxID=2861196 RepID=UPI001CD32B2F|nr:hypothetical protein [Cesiribacter sp. SM1]
MSKLNNLLVLALILALGIMSACKDEAPQETDQQVKTRQLNNNGNPWNITSVAVTGTNDYSYTSGASKIQFRDNNSFSVTAPANLPENRSPYGEFPASGTWAFASATNLNSIVLTAGTTTIPLTITTLSDNSLVFTYDGALDKAENEVDVTVTAQQQ